MKVLLTGANGFLGSWLLERLLEEGHEVSVILRNTKDFDLYSKRGVHPFHGDVTNFESLHAATQGQQQIYHLAGLIAYKRSQYDDMIRVNVDGTENILNAAAAANVQRVLLASSVVAVGATETPQILNEASPYNLDSLHLGYHESKRAAEKLICRFVSEGKVDGVIVNPSTVYGAGDASKGSRSTQVQVARGELFYYPPGGVSVVAVEDVVDGMVRALQKGRSGERYILAGENLTLKNVFDLIASEAGVKSPWLPLPARILKTLAFADDRLSEFNLSGPISSERAIVAGLFHWYDSGKARQELGFSTRPAQQAIANSVRWMAHKGLLRK